MANNAQQQGPQSWAEKVLALAWQFRRYRTVFTRGPPTSEEYANNRQEWAQYNIGRRDRRRLRSEAVGNWIRNMVQRQHGAPNLNITPPQANAHYRMAREKLTALRNLFTSLPHIEYIKALGFGGNGLAIRFRANFNQQPFDFVLKVSLRNWESATIRAETKETRKLDRAAHCIQTIPREQIGLMAQRPYEWEYPDEDDSSGPEDSSGDESRADGPGPDVRTGRRPRNEAERNALIAKKARHDIRVRAAYRKIEDRDDAIALRHEQGINPPREEEDADVQERRADFLILELCENGDLENVLYRVNEVNAVVPNRVLWGFWLCMVRACVAMQYPPRKFHPRRREQPEFSADGVPVANTRLAGKTVGDELYEDVPDPRRRWAQKRHVHFDIDPQNILLTGIDVLTEDNEHKIIPRLKLTDFGLAKEVKPGKRNIYYANLRDMAKHGYYAPEQFGIDWDFIRPHNAGPGLVGPGAQVYRPHGGEISEEPVAGNYGPHTNVWQMALVAWQLMTKMMPPVPPQLQAKQGWHADLPDNYAAAILTEPLYDFYDIELRQTIARCLAHNPRDRPTTRQLLQQAKQGINKVFAQEPDAVIKQWVQEILFDA